MSGPLEQFSVKTIIPISLLGYDISLTNSALAMICASLIICVWLAATTKNMLSVPSKGQMLTELVYSAIGDVVRNNAGPKGEKFIGPIFAMFLFILACNALGMLPFCFTATSQLVVTFTLAMAIFVMVTCVGFINHGWHFLSLFLPAGVPWWMAPLMIAIELFTYLARPVSLSLRLMANMVAGHILLKILAGFIIMLPFIFKIVPIPVIIILTAFEICVGILQAYIFTILSCVYLNDALNLH
jgi:F-type H+-transporting ATPase subunit a